MTSLHTLNEHFALSNALIFRALDSGLIVADIATPLAQASVSLQGGHLMHWQPATQAEPVLWMSRDARFEPGKSIRGGVPVCWPWFGPHGSDSSFPAHGCVRAANWLPVASHVEADGAIRLDLQWQPDDASAEFWPHSCTLELRVTVGSTLRMELHTRNTGTQSFVLGEALHTYFKISDIGAISIEGLDGVAYWDTVGGVKKKHQRGSISFTQETDRVYIYSDQTCVIHDPGLQRRIHISKRGSLSTVVWNPWTAKAERMGDLGQPDGWRGFVCVESANAWDNCLTLESGDSHTLTVVYEVQGV